MPALRRLGLRLPRGGQARARSLSAKEGGKLQVGKEPAGPQGTKRIRTVRDAAAGWRDDSVCGAGFLLVRLWPKSLC